ncbi:MAG TPA: molecular chaperone DnaJ [Arcobacter sp.]|nr:molecular chaperone DnaJ [Arcobacter sp.]
MRKIVGIALIAFGVFLEVLWIGFCFGSVIIGILLLIFAPRILFFPFTFFMAIGLSLILGDKFKSAKFKYQNYSKYSSSSQPNYTSQDTIDKYYKTLESLKTDDLSTIKSNYRRLIKKYHYDSIASQNLSDEIEELYKQKTQELNEAYSAIKEHLK